MPLTPDQIRELKDQLREQVKHLSPEKKKQAEDQIESLSSEALEDMLKQQASQQKPGSPSKQSNKGLFRSLIDKEIPSKIIDETKDAISVLDIKPISNGHMIVIPKKALSDIKFMPTSVLSLSKKLAKRAVSKLGAKGAEIQTEFKFGEIIVNVIPVYDSAVSINSPRKDVSDKDLADVQSILRVVRKPRMKPKQKPMPVKTISAIRMSRRIP